ncbi:DOMON-like domain-containing protein [Phenylobacterium sp.]|uniref:DOMON-like domain-containing protein n=1 Tax=Phenylobacterium sp. TaxID=1871053 RepID=UPI003BA8E378
MRSVELTPHPQFASNAADHVEVAIDRGSGGVLTLSYVVTGRVSALKTPPRAAPTRMDELWKHTCFEVFLRAPGSAAYYEFNLAPSSQWAAYAFIGYRERDEDPETPAPFIDAEGGRTRFELRASLDVGGLADLPPDQAWRVGLSAVLEADDGTRAYWALVHPPGQPDFHHADAFALSLPPPAA